MKIDILHRISGKIIFSHSCKDNTTKLTVEAAVTAKVSLDYARLDYARLVGASLDYARLDYARLDGARLDYASLVGASLDGASLVGASLVGARLVGASLVGASLDGARLVGARLVGASLVGARLVGARLVGASLKTVEKISTSDRPVFIIGPLGTDQHQLIAFDTDKGLRLQTGCFFGTLDEFKAALEKKHSKNLHAQEYIAALSLIENHFKIWPAKKS